MKLTSVLAVLFSLAPAIMPAQDAAVFKKNAEAYLTEGNYERALKAFLQYDALKPGSQSVMVNIGICCFQVNRLEEAENWLKRSLEQKKTAPAEVFLYLGKVYHAMLQFEQAVDFYKAYLKKIPANHPLRTEVKEAILHCSTGQRVRRLAPDATVVNLGDDLNSTADDFKPLPHPREGTTLYFSSDRPIPAGNYDRRQSNSTATNIFQSELIDGEWSTPKPLSIFVNTGLHEIALGFDDAGERLFFYRGNGLTQGSVLVDTPGRRTTEPSPFVERLPIPLHWQEGDSAPFFFNDSILLFASKRPGGFGGLDLYVSARSGDTWSRPENLGEPINTPYDETSPFLAKDGRTLFFSSNHPERSIGGLDILSSTYIDRQIAWMLPQNLGLPLNSAEDDSDFFLLPDGRRAFFSSSRKEGLGKLDLYVALFERAFREQSTSSEPLVFYHVPARRRAAQGDALFLPPLPDDIFEKTSPLILHSIYYDSAQVAPLPGSLRDLNLLALLMKKFPQQQLTLVVHQHYTDDMTGEVSLCEKVMHRVLDYLRQQEAPLDNLVVELAGSSYPLVAGNSPESKQSNRRIDLFMRNKEALGHPIHLAEPAVGANQAAPAGQFFRKAMAGLFFRVETPIDNPADLERLRRQFPSGTVQFLPAQNHWLYNTGIYLTYISAEELRRELAKKGEMQTKVSAYFGGGRLTKEDARQLLEQYPDLVNLIQQQ